MKLLLDTHVVLWMLGEPERLCEQARNAIADPDNLVFVSAASVWEMAIKQQIGKLKLPGPVHSWLRAELADRDVQTLPIDFDAAAAVANLPMHHRDPFDRVIIAQAGRSLTVVTHDKRFGEYAVDVIWT